MEDAEATSGDVETITFTVEGGESLDVSVAAARLSGVAAGLLDAGGDRVVVDATAHQSRVMAKLVEYLTYHATVAPSTIIKPLASNVLSACGASEWDAAYVDVECDMLFDLLEAAAALEIEPLTELCCAQMALGLRGKTAPALKGLFHISNDFTEEEEAAIREENRWAEDE